MTVHRSRVWAWAVAVGLLGVIGTGCQERLTAPAECPELCPGGSVQIYDTVVSATPGLDSSFSGYVGRGSGVALLVANGLPTQERAIYRFQARSDSIAVRDTLRGYTVDSVSLSFTLVARDTLVPGQSLQVYRLPALVDSTATFAGVDSLLVDSSLVTTIAIPDTLRTGGLRAVLTGAELDRLGLQPGGDSVLAIGAKLVSSAPTGIRLGSLAGSNPAGFFTFATVDIPDTGAVRNQTIASTTAFNTFVTELPVVPVDSLLTVGGEPSSRALIRFALPRTFMDSVKIVRATLELIPAAPITGLPADPGFIEERYVLGDIGAKSPVTSDARFVVTDTLPAFTTDTVKMEVTPTLQLWQTTPTQPQALFVLLRPEGATFTRAVFGSTRSPSIGGPRLHLTFQRTFPFQSP